MPRPIGVSAPMSTPLSTPGLPELFSGLAFRTKYLISLVPVERIELPTFGLQLLYRTSLAPF
jgi:hypothetical protein